MNSAVGRLVQAELKLMVRDPLVLTFVVAFPIVTMLIIGGAFGTTARSGIRLRQSRALVRGVVPDRGDRRDGPGDAAGPPGVLSRARRAPPFCGGRVPALVVPDCQLIVGLATITVGCALLLAGRRAGLRPSPDARVVAGHGRARTGLGRFVSLGVVLGSVLPSARSAQAVGLLIFFPSFLLGAGGPPPHVMGSVVRQWRAPAADVADQRGARALARPRVSYRIPGSGSRPGGGRHCPRGPPDGPVTRDSAVRRTAMPGLGRPEGRSRATGPFRQP